MAIGEPRPALGRILEVPIEVAVPLDRLALLPAEDGDGRRGLPRLVMTGVTEGGDRLPVKQKEVPVELAAPSSEDGALGTHRFEITADLPPGRWTIAVAVEDRIGGRVSYLRVAGTVEGPAEPEPTS